MKTSKSSRIIWIISLLVVLSVGLLAFPIIQSEWLMRKYESRIKQAQDPEELRSWAIQMFAIYATNRNQLTVSITNLPPKEIPASKDGPRIWIEWHDTDKGPLPCVAMMWKGTRAMGLYVGDTNFVKSDGEMWKAGIYFYREP